MLLSPSPLLSTMMCILFVFPSSVSQFRMNSKNLCNTLRVYLEVRACHDFLVGCSHHKCDRFTHYLGFHVKDTLLRLVCQRILQKTWFMWFLFACCSELRQVANWVTVSETGKEGAHRTRPLSTRTVDSGLGRCSLRQTVTASTSVCFLCPTNERATDLMEPP